MRALPTVRTFVPNVFHFDLLLACKRCTDLLLDYQHKEMLKQINYVFIPLNVCSDKIYFECVNLVYDFARENW